MTVVLNYTISHNHTRKILVI